MLRDRLRAQRSLAPPIVALVALGVAYALRVPLGLPYDEPSHWQNVLHLADTGRLPVVGGSGVSYEAVQGPLAYVVDAVALRVVEAVGVDGSAAQAAVRLLQIPWLIAAFVLLVALLARLLPRVAPGHQRVAALVALGTPAALAVGTSVQNDLPALTLCLAALVVLGRTLAEPGPQPRQGLVLGVLCGLAFLAKATVWPIGVVVVGALVVRRRPRAALLTVVTGLVVAGWWVVRNLVLYDSLTGTGAVADAGYDFPPSGWNGAGSVVELGRGAVTFLWLPVEYWRNAVDAPTVLAVAVVGATAVLLVLGVGRRWSTDTLMLAVVALAVLSVVTWAVTTVAFTNASARLAYPALAAWAVVVVRALPRWSFLAPAALVLLAVLHAWALVVV